MTMDLTCTLSNQPALLTWAGIRCSPGRAWDWGYDAKAMGVIEVETGKLRAVMVLNAFYDEAARSHIASDHSRSWATPAILGMFFHYIFVALQLERVIACTEHDNQAAIILMVKMGFTIEGRLRTSLDGKKSETIGQMFREECPWLPQPELERNDHGQEIV